MVLGAGVDGCGRSPVEPVAGRLGGCVMTLTTCRLLCALSVALGSAAPASGLVAGGGPATSDCYAEWQVTTADVKAKIGRASCRERVEMSVAGVSLKEKRVM